MSKTLVYERTGEGDKYLPLIISPENAKATAGSSMQAPFVVANSMREVQPDINVLVSPIPERLFARTPEGVPGLEPARGGGRLMTDIVPRQTRCSHDTAEALDPLGDVEEGRGSRTAPRSARRARRRCSTPTVRARSWTCPGSR